MSKERIRWTYDWVRWKKCDGRRENTVVRGLYGDTQKPIDLCKNKKLNWIKAELHCKSKMLWLKMLYCTKLTQYHCMARWKLKRNTEKLSNGSVCQCLVGYWHWQTFSRAVGTAPTAELLYAQTSPFIVKMFCITWDGSKNIAENIAPRCQYSSLSVFLSFLSAALQCFSAHAQTDWERATATLSSPLPACITDKPVYSRTLCMHDEQKSYLRGMNTFSLMML